MSRTTYEKFTRKASIVRMLPAGLLIGFAISLAFHEFYVATCLVILTFPCPLLALYFTEKAEKSKHK